METSIVSAVLSAFVSAVAFHLLSQLLLPARSHAPPVVFHWLPFIGNAVGYGINPYAFFRECQAKYGNVFTFVLFGRKVTVCLGIDGNDFILNGKLKDVNAEEIYSALTTPVFGSDVVYDCPNSKLMEQKKFVKFGLTTEAFVAYVPLIEDEVRSFIRTSPYFRGESGQVNISAAMAELTLYTASRTLQGAEVRSKLNSSFADLYHDLDLGFSPVNFLFPWAPLPRNRKRDRAQRKMRGVYMDIINARRQCAEKDGEDMLWHLMSCEYKNGQVLPDKEIAHMMITLLMAGQHSSSATSAWIMLRLASRPDIMEELYEEQVREFGADLPPLRYEDLSKLALNQKVVKETLRLHSSIHSIMRKAMNPLPVPGTEFVVPANNVLLASPGYTARSESHFKDSAVWDPHRWDEGNMEVIDEGETVDYGYGVTSKGTKSPYIPFGAGRHRCIGEQFAYLNLGVIVAIIVREFKFKNLPGVEGVVETDFTSLFSRPLEPALFNWKRRNAIPEERNTA